MLLYRVFPYLATARPSEPGHPLYVHPDQGRGRWDNWDLYRAVYAAGSPSGAVGEAFAGLSTWSKAMLPFPSVPGSARAIGVYAFDEEANALLDLDDARMLLERNLRPTDVVVRNRPRTQGIARMVHSERRWAGMSWWSMHRPQWTLHVIWTADVLRVERVESLAGHPGLLDAGRLLAKRLEPDIG
jgi:RES domain-containing protein